MKTLKQLALLPLFCGLLLTVGCNGDNNNDNDPYNGNELGERLLPSRILEIWEHSNGPEMGEFLLSYDDQNRITKIINRGEWVENGHSGEWKRHTEVTYNPDGMIATIKVVWESGNRTSTFTYSGDTITRIRIRIEEDGSSTDTTHFEVNDRGQITRMWGEHGTWELVYTYNTNGNLTHMVFAGQEEVYLLEYSPTIRAVFRYTATPEWVLEFLLGEVSWFLPKHGFMPVRFWRENQNWENTFTYTEENGYVRTMTIRINNVVDYDEGFFSNAVIYFEYTYAEIIN